jgi:pyrroloquinoline-quinone synthase
MDIREQLEERISSHRLLKHPFYEAWSCGELPVDSLKVYAEEYGAFIKIMPEGWTTLNDKETAHEEEHAELWADFAKGLDTEIKEAQITETKNLVETAHNLSSQPNKALGALFAFKVPQPETADSKLVGLKEFYSLPQITEPYFEEHQKKIIKRKNS